MARFRIGLLTTMTLLCATPALGGFFEELYRGLGFYATPSGSPIQGVPGGGRSNGNRFGRIRVVPNEFGEGHRIEIDRNFGADSRGRPEVFDLGNLELQLSGVTSLTLGYTTRGIPTGDADIFANQLNYALRAKSGAQDLELQGTLDVNQQIEFNQLGFYSIQYEINNTDSTLTSNGLVVDGDVDTDFDVGPISVRGNIFFDTALALLTTFGVDTTSVEGIFPASPIDRINDDIEAFFREQGRVLGEVYTGNVDSATIGTAGAGDDPLARTSFRIPEPASLVLLGLLGLAGLRRRA